MAHSSLRNHRKLRRLMSAARLTKSAAVGHLHCLWWSVYDSSAIGPDGVLHGWDEMDIATCAEFAGDADEFVQHLVDTRFIDVHDGTTYAIHDYVDWAPEYVKKRWDRQGYTEHRTYGRQRPTTADNGPQREPTEPNRTEPNRTEPAVTQRNQTDTGTGLSQKEPAASHRTQKGFCQSLTLRLIEAFKLNGEAALRQQKAFMAVARTVMEHPERDELAKTLVKLAKEKQADPTSQNPMAVWQSTVNEMFSKG